jgi:hypothetical protein
MQTVASPSLCEVLLLSYHSLLVASSCTGVSGKFALGPVHGGNEEIYTAYSFTGTMSTRNI